jgi:hypothetical protein
MELNSATVDVLASTSITLFWKNTYTDPLHSSLSRVTRRVRSHTWDAWGLSASHAEQDILPRCTVTQCLDLGLLPP